ncbi:MAG: M10 family metallopeptidase C-terminal domain-containing protein [Planctomycetota bacterium]|nr:M10 family metallopeptidase C-terminal domain-containing protein [Planctomycetota bacterium]
MTSILQAWLRTLELQFVSSRRGISRRRRRTASRVNRIEVLECRELLTAGMGGSLLPSTGPTTGLFVPLYSFPQFTDFSRSALSGWWRDVRDQATATNPITVIVNPSNGTADPTNPSSDFGVYRDAIRLLRQNPNVAVLGYVYTQGGVRPQSQVIQNIDWYQNYYLNSSGSSMIDGIFVDELASSSSQLSYYQTLATNIRARTRLAGTTIIANPGVVPASALLSTTVADVLVTFENVENSSNPNDTDFVDAGRPAGGSANLKYAAIIHSVPTAADRDRVLRLAKVKGFNFVYVTDDVMFNPFDAEPTYWSGIATELNRPVAPDRVVSVVENSPAGTVVGTIPGFDPNPGQSVAYSIVGGNVSSAFAIHPTTGQVTVNNAAALDFETTPVFNLMVQVTDNGVPALSGTGIAQVQLIDVPDSLDIRVDSATTNGQSTISVNYSIFTQDAPAFELRFAKSADTLYGAGDVTLGSITLTNPSDRTIGSHTLQLPIGTLAGQIALPGTLAADGDDDYRILVVADPTNAVVEADLDPLNEDNTQSLSGAYLAGGTLFGLGREVADSLLISKTTTTYSLNFNGVVTTYPLASVTKIRLRGEGGDDTLSAASVDRAIALFGGDGNDILTGGTLADRIVGGAGNDESAGGTGNDLYVFDADEAQGADSLTDVGGVDTLDFSLTTTRAVAVDLGLPTAQVVQSASLTLTLNSATAFENLIGGSGDDTLMGNTLANTLSGGGGNDLLSGGSGNDTLVGEAGNDTLRGDLGNDLYLFDADSLLGSDTIDESAGGVDTLDFSATSNLGVVVNLGVAAAQIVNSNLTLTLGSSTTIENVTGGSRDDTLTGNAGANVLVGGAGNDVLTGNAGNDTYAFNAAAALGSDTLVELTGGGTDTLDFSSTTTIGVTVDLSLNTTQVVNSHLTLTLVAGNVFENLTGGSLDDQLTGNSLANAIVGNSGNDTILGAAGADSLTGAAGNDVLTGGDDNDTYLFDSDSPLGSDTIVESTTGGGDTVNFSATTGKSILLDLSLTSPQVVNSNLTLALSAGDVVENLTGGSLNDVLTGNGLANTLIGGPGNDLMTGLDGNDAYLFDADVALGSDTIVETSTGGTDIINFTGTTTLTVTLNLSSIVTQVVNAKLSLTLSAGDGIENLIGGALNDLLTGNSLPNSIDGGAGNDVILGFNGNDTLIGGAGDDSLNGGAGDDVYSFTANSALGTDSISETLAGGVDSLDFSTTTVAVSLNLSSAAAQVVNANLTVSLTGTDVIENVTGGSGNDILVGNALANTLAGGLGNDTLTGAGGDDWLIGGAGNDLYLFDTDLALGNDTLDESAGGVDTLDFSATSTQNVAVNLEVATQQVVNANLRLTLGSATTFENVIGGDLNDMLTGNANANTLTGNGGDDVLTGRAGNDSLIGGAGNDRYTFAADSSLGTDTLNETGGGIDTLDFSGTVSTAVTINLATATAQVVNANLSVNLGSATNFENVIGGALGDTLTGNTLANDLNGGDGNDVLTGAAGDDVLTGGLGDDTFKFTANTALGSDTVVEVAGQGNDLLDFSTTTTQSISLDLASTVPQVLNANLTLRLSAGDSFEMVVGTTLNDTILGNSLNNVLFGGAGLDTLYGLGGRDLLIGGTGVDTLDGGEDDDIVVGGITTYYNESTKALDQSAISAIVAEWVRIDINYDTRVANLRSGVGAGGAYKLTALTLLADGTANDSLSGGNGRDWFWKFGGDVLGDAIAGELAN